MNRKKLIVAAVIVGVILGVPALVVASIWAEIDTPPMPVVRATRVEDPATDGAYCLRLTEVKKGTEVGLEFRVRGLAATEWWEFGRATRFAWEDVGLDATDGSELYRPIPFAKKGEMRVSDLVCGLSYDMWYTFQHEPSHSVFYRSEPNCTSALDQPTCPGPWPGGRS